MVEIWANSNSAADFQAAVNQAIASGVKTIRIPNGDSLWAVKNAGAVSFTVPSGGLDIFAEGGYVEAYTNHTITYPKVGTKTKVSMPACILRASNDSTGSGSGNAYNHFAINGNLNKLRMRGFSLLGKVAPGIAGDLLENTGIETSSLIDCVFQDMYFDSFTNQGIMASQCKGVVTKSHFDNTYKDVLFDALEFPVWGYGIICGSDGTWLPMGQLLGKYDTVPNGQSCLFVEDTLFERCRHSVDGAWYVARHNVISDVTPWNNLMINNHGGQRGMEIYSNAFIGSEWFKPWQPPLYASRAIGYRGGGGVCYNNTFTNIASAIALMNDGGTSDPTQLVNDVWIWNNAGRDAPEYLDSNIVQGKNFYLYAPSGYTPYTYPHPLTLPSGTTHQLTVNSNINGVPFNIRRVA